MDDPVDDRTEGFRQEFYRINGKTPEQEAEGSARMLGLVSFGAIGVVILSGIGYLLYSMFT